MDDGKKVPKRIDPSKLLEVARGIVPAPTMIPSEHAVQLLAEVARVAVEDLSDLLPHHEHAADQVLALVLFATDQIETLATTGDLDGEAREALARVHDALRWGRERTFVDLHELVEAMLRVVPLHLEAAPAEEHDAIWRRVAGMMRLPEPLAKAKGDEVVTLLRSVHEGGSFNRAAADLALALGARGETSLDVRDGGGRLLSPADMTARVRRERNRHFKRRG